MRTHLECIPCFLRQTFAATRLATGDLQLQEEIFRAVLRKSAETAFHLPPAYLGTEVYRIIRARTGNPNPYQDMKDQLSQLALSLEPRMRERIRNSSHPFEAAARMAIGGNVVDFGSPWPEEPATLEEMLDEALASPLAINDLREMEEAVQRAKSILYIGNNASEAVFDRLFIEELPPRRVAFAVKVRPVFNNATIEDAVAAGLSEVAQVVDTGSDMLGTMLEMCSEEFRARFQEADVVIAKGQSNYETLDTCGKPRLFFMLKARCPVVARSLGCAAGGLVVRKSPH